MAVGMSRNKEKYAGELNEKLEEEVDGCGQWLPSAVSVWVPYVLLGQQLPWVDRTAAAFLIHCRQILEDLYLIKRRLLPPNKFSFHYKLVKTN